MKAAYGLRAFAREDLEAIWQYTFEQWGIEQAQRYLEAMFTCFEDLVANPQLGRERDDVKPGYRSFPQGRHVVFYKIGESSIEIIGIVHQSVDVDGHLGAELPSRSENNIVQHHSVWSGSSNGVLEQ